MKKIFIIIASIAVGATAWAQSAREEFEAFRNETLQEFEDFREEANQKYMEFMLQAWEEFELFAGIEEPKMNKIQPAVCDDPVPPTGGVAWAVEVIDMPPAPLMQPKPLSPIKEHVMPSQGMIEFNYYGTPCKIRFNKNQKFKLKNLKNRTVANAWKHMMSKPFNNTLNDLLQLRDDMRLNDWAYLMLLKKFVTQAVGDGSEANLLMCYLFSQSGYKMRLARDDKKLLMLIASDYTFYGHPFTKINGETYYSLDKDIRYIRLMNMGFPEEQGLSMLITKPLTFDGNFSDVRSLKSRRYQDAKGDVSVDLNLIEFYNDYPATSYGNNFMTKWALYANTPLATNVKASLYPSLKQSIEGFTPRDAANKLLNFVQTAFVYQYDEVIWGYDRAFFAEESLYYPYCDCEDRSILYSRLVRDILGLDVALVYYPGHLATAVHFDEDVPGDYIMVDGRKFIIADPTYIESFIGSTATGMNNDIAKAIVLKANN